MAYIFLTAIGYPPIQNWSTLFQGVSYLAAMLILLVATKTKNTMLRYICGGTYGFLAMLTFAGVIQWVGGLEAYLAMALWDLGLGVTIFMNESSN